MAAEIVFDLSAQREKALQFGVDETDAFIVGGERQAAPEHEPAVLLERLARIDRLEADVVGRQPREHVIALVDQDFLFPAQRSAGVEAQQVGAELLLRIGAEIGPREPRIIRVAEQGEQILVAVIGEAHGAGRVLGIAAGEVRQRLLGDEDAGTLFERGNASAKGCVT